MRLLRSLTLVLVLAALAAGSAFGAGPSSSFSGSGTLGGSDEGDGGSGSVTIGAAASNGMSVAAVRQLQSDLARLGYFHHVVTGYYGVVTTAAVKRFQHAAGLKPDGVWGPLSTTALQKRLARG